MGNDETGVKRMHTNILEMIGNTPLVFLSRLFAGDSVRLFGKLEGTNPGGSAKDRAAYHMIKRALENGVIHAGSTIIESSSGNMGIGLAQICAYFGLRFICVVDPKTTRQNMAILGAYGAEIDLVTEPSPTTGEFLDARIERVQRLRRSIPDSWWPDQYANLHNAQAHYQTMHEIVTGLDRSVDYVICATSTCGTLRGCAEYIRTHQLTTKVIAVDAVGSVIFGTPPGKRLIPGHGAIRRPALYQPGLADCCVHVTDLDCVVGCRRLLRCEAILAGGSSGAVIAAIDKLRPELPANATLVAVLCDRGERYLDTIYNDAWVAEHFGNVAQLWETREVAIHG
jgi:cysteine synthase A